MTAEEKNPATVRPRALVLFGPPGSGKGTQAKLLRDALGMPHISTGDMLRDHIEAGDEIGRKVEALMRAGTLVPDELVNQLVEVRLARADCRTGVLLDGYPRTLAQAKALEKLLDAKNLPQVVIHLLVDYNRIIARLTGRRQCPMCGTLYSLTSKPPKVDMVCDLDGTALVVRPDDCEDVIRQRLDEYESLTRPLLDYFAASGRPFHEVAASERTPEEVFSDIRRLIATS